MLVTVNYRVGPFGFFAHPALRVEGGPEADLANFALADQMQALRWIQENIGAFGGDPNNATVFGGVSSGAGLALALVASEAAGEGLFHKAIVQSATLRAGIRNRNASLFSSAGRTIRVQESLADGGAR